MPDAIYLCPEDANFQVLSNARLRCRDDANQDAWVEVTEEYDVSSLLQSIASFDPVQTSLFTTGYLVIFIVGYSVGTVIRLMKKA